jgi:hypothetical protein
MKTYERVDVQKYVFLKIGSTEAENVALQKAELGNCDMRGNVSWLCGNFVEMFKEV